MADFFQKVCPSIELPSPTTLASIALDDVYKAVHFIVKDMISDTRSVYLLFDGWMDKHKACSFLGIRASFIKNCKYRIVTLSCHVLPTHTSREVSEHVSMVLREFVGDNFAKHILLSFCHDGAANMLKSSQMLKVDHYQHCTAHALYLLLTVDSVNQVDELVTSLQKCKDVVSALHFKFGIIEDELTSKEDRTVMEKLKVKITAAQIIDLDKQYAIDENGCGSDNALSASASDSTRHHYENLKMACPTRWNSTLQMIESIIYLRRETMNTLKRIGKAVMCIDADEYELLDELRQFLKCFETFTVIVSTHKPTLSLVPLIKLEIKKSAASATDSEIMKIVKHKILSKLNTRLPETVAVIIHQLLDPGTKHMIAQDVALEHIEKVTSRLCKKRLIYDDIHSLNAQLRGKNQCETDSPASKIRRLKEEMVNEMRGRTDAGNGSGNLGADNSEIMNYLSLTVKESDTKVDILQFW